MLEQLAKMGLQGSKFICEKVKMSQEMNLINETLLDKIGELKDIVWMVNCKLKSVRAAVELEKSYSETVATWTLKINELVIPENYAKTIGRELRISGYTPPIIMITEDSLVTMLDSFKGKEKTVVVFMTKKKVKLFICHCWWKRLNKLGTI